MNKDNKLCSENLESKNSFSSITIFVCVLISITVYSKKRKNSSMSTIFVPPLFLHHLKSILLKLWYKNYVYKLLIKDRECNMQNCPFVSLSKNT